MCCLPRRATRHQRLRGGGKSVQRPSYTSAAMPIDSPSVGCGWIVLPMSDAVRAHLDRQRDLADHVAGIRADDAAADDAVRLLVEQQLGEAFVAAVGDRAARGGPREQALADLDALRPWLRPRSGRPTPLPDRCRPPTGSRARRSSAFCRRAPTSAATWRFVHGLVRQHRLADDVADREDVRHVGAHLHVDRDEAAVGHRHAGLVRADLLAVRACGRRPPARGRRSALRRGAPSPSNVTLMPSGRRFGADGLRLQHDVVEALARCTSARP